MSTKTTFKRIALVAVASLGFGMLSVAPSSAAGVADGTDNSTVTAITAGTAGAVQVGQSVQVPVTVTGSFTTATARILKLAVIGVTAPTGATPTYKIALPVSGVLTDAVDSAAATVDANSVVSKWYPTGTGHLGGASFRLVDGNNATTQITTSSSAPTATSVTVYVTFTPTVAGNYSFTVINDKTAGGTLTAGEVSSSLVTVATAAPAATAVITMLNTGTAQASTAGVVAKIQLLDAAGAVTAPRASDVISLSSSSTAMTINGAASANLVAADFGAGTPSSGFALLNLVCMIG
jgi:VCBS repeat-containing protein